MLGRYPLGASLEVIRRRRCSLGSVDLGRGYGRHRWSNRDDRNGDGRCRLSVGGRIDVGSTVLGSTVPGRTVGVG